MHIKGEHIERGCAGTPDPGSPGSTPGKASTHLDRLEQEVGSGFLAKLT